MDHKLPPNVRIDRHRDSAGEAHALAEDVLDGLTRPDKELPAKWLYDARGSALFDEISELPEYYPTRTERAILMTHAQEIAALTGAAEVVELGAGYATKTQVLLDALREAGTLSRYVLTDVSDVTVEACARRMAAEYPGLRVQGQVADFDHDLVHLPAPEEPRLLALLGSTIGNFMPGSRRRFLREIATHLGRDGHLLLGADLVKDRRTLEAAYDDAAGVTAAFNRNVLTVINRELGGNFDVEAFDHVAFYDDEREWIEMRLRASTRQRVRLSALDLDLEFVPREELRTEISAKFTLLRLERDLAAAGLEVVRFFTDPSSLFCVTLAQAR